LPLAPSHSRCAVAWRAPKATIIEGKARIEGKDDVMNDGDVVVFRLNV
jgi:ribosome-binding ATPase YchF (GTP1/OBG family)